MQQSDYNGNFQLGSVLTGQTRESLRNLWVEAQHNGRWTNIISSTVTVGYAPRRADRQRPAVRDRRRHVVLHAQLRVRCRRRQAVADGHAAIQRAHLRRRRHVVRVGQDPVLHPALPRHGHAARRAVDRSAPQRHRHEGRAQPARLGRSDQRRPRVRPTPASTSSTSSTSSSAPEARPAGVSCRSWWPRSSAGAPSRRRRRCSCTRNRASAPPTSRAAGLTPPASSRWSRKPSPAASWSSTSCPTSTCQSTARASTSRLTIRSPS